MTRVSTAYPLLYGAAPRPGSRARRVERPASLKAFDGEENANAAPPAHAPSLQPERCLHRNGTLPPVSIWDLARPESGLIAQILAQELAREPRTGEARRYRPQSRTLARLYDRRL